MSILFGVNASKITCRILKALKFSNSSENNAKCIFCQQWKEVMEKSSKNAFKF